MSLAALLFLWVLLPFSLQPAEEAERERASLEERARDIVRQNQDNEITTTEARRRVELLLRDLVAWSEEHAVELIRRSQAYNTPATGRGELLTADRCSLFYEEDLERLCPLDLSRSEVWGAKVLFCRYLCAPDEP